MISSILPDDNLELSDCFNKEYFCGKCGNSFHSGSVLKHHMKATHNLDLKTYIRQFEVHKDERVLVDSITEDLSKEAVNMDSEVQYTCEKCFKTCPNKRSLLDHTRYKHGDVSTCKTCSKTFLSKRKLKCHESMHNGYKYFCQICNRGFFLKQNKNRHVECCLNLKRRRRVSFSDHKCELCDKFYITQDVLTQHKKRFHKMDKKITMKVKPSLFGCKYCSQEFRLNSELAIHSKIHISSKEYVLNCEACQKVFTKKYQRNRHIRDVHGESFKCPKCETIYSAKHNMKSHMKHGCTSKYNIPWARLASTNTKIKRMNLIIAEINKRDSQLNKIKKLCLYNSLQAMSTDERETFQDLLDEYFQTIAPGKSIMTFEDIIRKMKDCWLGMSDSFSVIECDYCGEEVEDKTYLLKHMEGFHPTRLPQEPKTPVESFFT